jgi:ribosomal protein L16/L10AE
VNAHEIKAARTMLDKAKAELTMANVERGGIDRKISSLKAKITELERKARSNGQFRVREHALLRYVERVIKVDLGVLQRQLILEIEPQATRLGDGKYPFLGVCRAVVKDNTIVTIEPIESEELIQSA